VSFLSNQTTSDIKAMSPEVALLPIGAFEQHGDHLPLTTDTLIASIIAKELADAYDVLLLSPITISCSHEHAAFSGTVSITASTLSAVINDIADSLEHQGIRNLVLINAHGGNYVLGNIVQQANINGPQMALYPGRSDWEAARRAAGMQTNSHEDMHAGELETSILLHSCPAVVGSSYVESDHVANERPRLLEEGMHAYTKSGVIGMPSLARAEKGSAALSELVARFSDWV
jgi:creatinine amidohydrolase